MAKKDDKMIPIPINDVINGVTSPVDLYVKLSDTKFVLVAKEGSTTQRDKLSNYKSKEVYYLWTPYSSYYKLAKQNITIAGVAVTKKQLNPEIKTKFIASAANSVFEQLGQIGISRDTYENVRQVSEATVSLVENHTDLASMFESFERYDNHLLKHSMAVSVVSTLIATEMGWKNKVTLEKISLGALMHDIGKMSLSPELLNKPKAFMNHEELQAYEAHPFRGMEMVTSLGIVPDDVVSIIYEHHENSIGQGFPRRLRDVKIHPLAKVVALADQFTSLTIKMPSYPNQLASKDAVNYIEKIMGQPFNKECYKALCRLILKDSFKKTAS